MSSPTGRSGDQPVLQVTPKDLAFLIDRLQILFGRPATISEGRGFTASVTAEPLSIDALKQIVEATGGLEPSAPGSSSGLPFVRHKRPD